MLFHIFSSLNLKTNTARNVSLFQFRFAKTKQNKETPRSRSPSLRNHWGWQIDWNMITDPPNHVSLHYFSTYEVSLSNMWYGLRVFKCYINGIISRKLFQLVLLLFCVWRFIHFYCNRDPIIWKYHNIFIPSPTGDY